MNICLPTDKFPGITLDSMKKVKLMNRIDTKYLIPSCMLPGLLERCAACFQMQETDGCRMPAYETMYYDTPLCEAYLLHLHGHMPRQKVRTRTYVDGDGASFFEIKNKTNRGRTKKERIAIGRECFEDFTKSRPAVEFGEGRLRWPANELSPALLIKFNRLTLVNNSLTERITIDLNLRFENPRTSGSASLGEVAVIELKRDGTKHSDLQDILLQMRVFPAKFSKYCTGMMLTDESIPRGRFKERLITLKKNINKNA